MADPQMPYGAGTETPMESLYRKVIVPLVRGAAVLVVVFFLLGGIGAGIGLMDAIYGEDPQLDSNGVTYSCVLKSEAGPGQQICRYPTAVANVIGALGGGRPAWSPG
ncbi:MAG TPA: hypothetical protein VG795_16990 [Acidimicrobiia bacterium]|nr:hypothetical protein [Acidimicrobiia bacterium]